MKNLKKKKKKEMFLFTGPPTCLKLDSSFWFLRQDKKEIKVNFQLVCRNYNYNYFHTKISLKLRVKPFPHIVFFTDHLNHKTVNKVTYRTAAANPRQL